MLTAEQRAIRHQGIGASEIGAVVGAAGAWESQLSLWARKTGLVPEDDETEVPEHIELGNLLEPVIASLYTRRTGLELYEPGTLVHPTDPLRIATPDRLVRNARLGVQIKKARANGRWGEEGTDDCPESIICQVQWEISVADLEAEDVAVLFWGSHLAIYTIKRDDQLIAGLVEIAHKWWRDHVIGGTPPTPDESEKTKETLSKLFPANRGKTVLLGAPEFGTQSGDVFALVQDYVLAREEESLACKRKEGAGNALRLAIGDGDGFSAAWGKAMWTCGTTGRTNWKGLAGEFGALPETLIKKHTQPPERRLNVALTGEKKNNK